MIKVFTVAEMIMAEKAADGAGVSYAQMMETAGCCVAAAIVERCAVAGKHILILVGPGNNGGDGLVAGRYLAQAGAEVVFYLYKPRDANNDENFKQIQQMDLPIILMGGDADYQLLHDQLAQTDILIDALLGTGVTRPISGNLAELLRIIKEEIEGKQQKEVTGMRARLTVVGDGNGRLPTKTPLICAVDCPSGLNCDNGNLDPLAIRADHTVTFAGPKRGHFRFPGAGACGELIVADIDISTELPDVANVKVELATAVAMQKLLPPRPINGHKGTFGTSLIAAGSQHYFGAPLLAAKGAYRVGAGLVALALPQLILPTVAGQMPEATYPPITAENKLDAESVAEMITTGALARAKSLLVGPGLDAAAEFMQALLAIRDELPPLLVDADGLNLLAALPDWPKRLPPHTILTPHPGEMARLTGMSLEAVNAADRVELASTKAQEWGHVILLKGAYTVVANVDGRCHILPFANPALAVAGSGDVLSGIIAGLLAQGMRPYAAAVLGGFLHAAAGQLAADKIGSAGVLAHEIADRVPQARLALG